MGPGKASVRTVCVNGCYGADTARDPGGISVEQLDSGVVYCGPDFDSLWVLNAFEKEACQGIDLSEMEEVQPDVELFRMTR